MDLNEFRGVPIILLYPPEALEGRTAEECSRLANQDIDDLFSWLKRTCTAKGWTYTIHALPSITSDRNSEKVNLWINVLLLMNPIGFYALQEYWTGCKENERHTCQTLSRDQGNLVAGAKRQCIHTEALMRYMKAQINAGQVRTQSNIEQRQEIPTAPKSSRLIVQLLKVIRGFVDVKSEYEFCQNRDL